MIFYKRSFYIYITVYDLLGILYILKELRNCILCIIPVWSLICSLRVYKSLYFLPILLIKLDFPLSMFQFFVFLFLILRSFALSFEFIVLIDLITWYSQSGNKINHVLYKFVFTLFRSSHRRCFIKKAFFKNFTIFSWKHLFWGLIFIKLQGFSSATLSKRDSNTGVFL